MSIIKNSSECTKSELDLFYLPSTNTSIEAGIWAEHAPISLIDKSIDFFIAGTSNYVHLNRTHLYLNVALVNENGNLINENDAVGPVNNFANSLFKQVEVKLNGVAVEPTNNSYSYKAYLSDLLNFGEDAKNTVLQSALYIKDDPNEMDNINVNNLKTEQPQKFNNGLVKRRMITLDSKGNLELIAKLHCDIFNTDRILLNNVDIAIKIIRNDPSFCLMYDSAGQRYNVKINEAKLITRFVKIAPSVMVAHNLALEKTTAKYPIKRVIIENAIISQNLVSFSTSFPGKILPNRIVFGLVENLSHTGDPKKNPFNFQNFNVTSVDVKVDGQSITYASELKLNYLNNNYLRAFNTLFDNIDRPIYITGNNISREDYKNGYCLYVYDLSPDLCSGEHFNLLKTGNLSIHLTFGKAPESALQLVLFQEFDSLIEINQNRIVFSDSLK